MRIRKSGWVCSLTGNERSAKWDTFGLAAVSLAVLAMLGLCGCAGLVSGAGNTNTPPSSTLQITNVQVASATTSTCQIVWTTNVPANSQVDYGTTASYGSSTPLDSTMVTSHAVNVSGLAAGTAYYFQVSSTSTTNNNGKALGHFKTSGFSISGTITPAADGSGTTITLSGGASAATNVDATGNYSFTGLPNGNHNVTPSRSGYSFSPASQSPTLNGSNVSGVNFTAAAMGGAPTITTQPASQTVTAGQTASFTVVATGTAPLSYQWQKNGANITGATAASYTTAATTASDNGATFAVAVSNTAGTVTSAAATLTVNAAVAPTISTQPTNQTVTAGQTATFTVAATGAAPLSYQWQKNGANITGATATSYTTAATTTADSGSSFAAVVSNTAGTVTSTAAVLTVNAAPVAPTITTQPANQTVTAGQTATFAVVATGTAPLSYQWQKNGVNIAGATSASYTTPATTTADSGASFTAVVSNSAGTVTSSAAALTVNPAPAPGIQVSPASINFGNAVVGSTISQALIITNTGTSSLSITQVALSSAVFSVSGFSLPLNANPGQQTTITVAFLPTSVGASAGNISIVSNAPTSPTSVALSGTGIAATLNLNISPTSLSFGSITTGTSSASQNVTITNTGNSNVTISQISVSGPGYSITSGGAPATLSPSQSLTLTVLFSPNATGSASGSISIVSNANGSPASVALSGSGIAPVQHSVTLVLSASPSSVSGYNIYRSTVSGGPYIKVNSSLVTSLAYTDAGVQNGTTYFYVATAVDSGGNESTYSNEMQAAIP